MVDRRSRIALDRGDGTFQRHHRVVGNACSTRGIIVARETLFLPKVPIYSDACVSDLHNPHLFWGRARVLVWNLLITCYSENDRGARLQFATGNTWYYYFLH